MEMHKFPNRKHDNYEMKQKNENRKKWAHTQTQIQRKQVCW